MGLALNFSTVWLSQAKNPIPFPEAVKQVNQCMAEWRITPIDAGGIEYPPGEIERVLQETGINLPTCWGWFIGPMEPPKTASACVLSVLVHHDFWSTFASLEILYYLDDALKVQAIGIAGYYVARVIQDIRPRRMLVLLTDCLALGIAEILGASEIRGLGHTESWPFHTESLRFRWENTDGWKYFPLYRPAPPGTTIVRDLLERTREAKESVIEHRRWLSQLEPTQVLHMECIEDWDLFGFRMADGAFAWLPEPLVDFGAFPRKLPDIWELFREPTWEEFRFFHNVALTAPTASEIISILGCQPLWVLPGIKGDDVQMYRRGECEILVFDGVSENMLPIYIVTKYGVELSYALKEKEGGHFR